MELHLAQMKDLAEMNRLFRSCQNAMEREGNFSWSHGYPDEGYFKDDISAKSLYIHTKGPSIIAAISVSFDPLEEFFYDSEDPQKVEKLRQDTGMKKEEDFLIVHRLMIDPLYRGKHLSNDVFNAIKTLYPHRMMVFAVYPENLRARHAYLHEGFTEFGLYPFEYGKSDHCLLYFQRTSED